MNQTITITLPLKINNCTISLNWYRNAHFRTLASTKKSAGMLVKEQLPNPPIKPFTDCVQEVRFYPDNYKKDLKNFSAVACKFADDTIVEMGFLVDDSCRYLRRSIEEFVEIDKENPRIEIIYHFK